MSLVTPEIDDLCRNFRAGYLDATDVDFLPEGATAEAKNCLFTSQQFSTGMSQLGTPVGSVRASLSKRSGCALINPTPIGAPSRFDSLYEFRRENVSAGQLIASAAGGLWVWNNATAFTNLGGTGWSAAGIPTHWSTFKNLALGSDGVAFVAYDGANFFTPGLAAPTAEGGLANGGAGGALPAATWEAVQTWYDSTHDHDSNATAPSAQLVLGANLLRQHTIPGGAVPTNATHWRTWVRRVDTNEAYYRLLATTVVATGVITESVSDDARRLALVAPLPNQNTPPPVFLFTRPYQGYLLGVQLGSSLIWPSRPNDPQSFNPLEPFAAGAGDGQELKGLVIYNEVALAQKQGRTWRLQGDRMPFIPKELDNSLGAVSFECSVEGGDGWLYSWDVDKGPYRTNLSSWDPLGDGRIANFLKTVNKGALSEIKACHVKDLNTVFWQVPTGSTTRARQLIGYNYVLGCWLPPITGLEFGALSTFLTNGNVTNFYVGDLWGRMFQFFTGDRDGVPSGTLIARASAATNGTVTVDFEQTLNPDGTLTTTAVAAALYTTGAGLAGLAVGVVDNLGRWQIRRIQSNTGTVITLDTTHDSPWGTNPVPGGGATYTVVVGLIEWFWTSGIRDAGDPRMTKRGGYFYAQARGKTANFLLSVGLRYDGASSSERTVGEQLPTANAWGQNWGALIWGTGASGGRKFRLMRAYNRLQFQLLNYWPDQGVDILSAGWTADKLPRRLERSSG